MRGSKPIWIFWLASADFLSRSNVEPLLWDSAGYIREQFNKVELVPGDKGYGFDHYETAVLDQAYLAPVVEKFGLACFVPRLSSARDCMSHFLVEPRGTWFVAQTASSIAKLEACDSLRRI